MQKTLLMELIEARARKDIRLVLREAYEEAGSLAGAAALLSERYDRTLTFGQVSDWIERLDGRIVKTLQFACEPETAAV